MPRELASTVSQDRTTTARMLAQIAEVDARKLYVLAGYDSMYRYCVYELHISEDVACKRICAARVARRFPAIFVAVADGKLHVAALVLLAPHMTPDTADGLITAATHQTKARIELLLAQRFPKGDVPTLVQAVAPARAPEDSGHDQASSLARLSAPGRMVPSTTPNPPVLMAPPPAPAPAPVAARAKAVPLSPGRFALQVTVDQATHDQLRYAQTLLGHAVPSGDITEVLKRALDTLVEKLERQKFARSARSRPQRAPANGRHVQAAVRRAVWERDGGQCTFVSEQGGRCQSCTRLEFDHVEPVARGGQASVGGIRLRCRTHKEYAAECAFGSEFMQGKRQEARARMARARLGAPECTSPGASAPTR
jgi:hypothetical protein